MNKVSGIGLAVLVALFLLVLQPSVAHAQGSWTMRDCIRTSYSHSAEDGSSSNGSTVRPEATADSQCDSDLAGTSADVDSSYQYDFDFTGATLAPLYADVHLEADGSRVVPDGSGRPDDYCGVNLIANVYPAPYNSGISSPGAGGNYDYDDIHDYPAAFIDGYVDASNNKHVTATSEASAHTVIRWDGPSPGVAHVTCKSWLNIQGVH